MTKLNDKFVLGRHITLQGKHFCDWMHSEAVHAQLNFYWNSASCSSVAKSLRVERDIIRSQIYMLDQWIIVLHYSVCCLSCISCVGVFLVWFFFFTNHVIYSLWLWGWEWQIRCMGGFVIRGWLLRQFMYIHLNDLNLSVWEQWEWWDVF